MDGASSQSIYNQKFEHNDIEEASANEQSLFLTSITPLKLSFNNQTVWTNPRPSSPHFTRPLHLQYKKETKELTVAEEMSLREEIEGLDDFNIGNMFEDANVSGKIKYKVQITMLDGKAVNAITDTKSSQYCNICAATPKEMNDLEKIRSKPANQKAV